MLKWFRIYNKWLLVFFGSLLMVVFLIEGAVHGILPQPEDQPVGYIQGEKISFRDQAAATREKGIVEGTLPALSLLSPAEPMQWLLMVQGAKQAGLHVSDSQVAQLLSAAMGSAALDLDQMARNVGVSRDDLVDAYRHWLMIQQYMELTLGLAHQPVHEKLASLSQGLQYANMGIRNPQFITEPARGNPRISRPLLERFLQDQQASVTVQAVAISPERQITSVPDPDDAAITALYEAYKDKLPGHDEGYGLGYKLPDRVKLEYLTIPFQNVREKIEIEETEALSYYDSHTDEFLPAAAAGTTQPATPQPRPYLEVREQIIRQLTDDQAYQLATRIAQAAQAALIDNARVLGDDQGYRKITADWTPLSLSDLARTLETRFDVQLEVRRIDDRWLTLNELQTLPVLGSSSLPVGQQMLPAPVYIAGVRELEPGENHPAANLRLQVYLPSQPVTGRDGSVSIFRVTDAQPSHTPALADVRQQVARDARQVAAYKKNLEQMDKWQALLDQPLAAAARELNTVIIGPETFQRRDRFGSVAQVPVIPGVGRSKAFVDQVFKLALQARLDQPATAPADGKEDSPDQSIARGVIAADDAMTIYLVDVRDFTPMTQRDFDQQVTLPFNRIWLSQEMMQGVDSDVLDVDNLARRVGFTWVRPPQENH